MTHATADDRRLAQTDLEALRPRTEDELDRFLRRALGLVVPRQALVPGNDPPFDYLAHVFFEGAAAAPREREPGVPGPGVPGPGAPRAGDVVVWANRGGGKTLLGAVATLLDLMFKPGVRVRILGGSKDQSRRMFEHLTRLAQRPAIAPLLASPPTRDRIELINQSVAEICAQSERSVRGVRVHKLRCDEVELFKPHVWQAAQLTTRSGRCGPVAVRGALEAMSTMHEVGGLMSKLVERPDLRVLRWSAIDVIERCPPQRPCDGCPLWRDCQGLAKQANGFIPVDDLIQQWHRCSDPTWDAEMMCRRPSIEHTVFPTFDPAPGGKHVAAHDEWDPAPGPIEKPWQLIAGLDFGLRNPLVMLWARFRPDTRPGADPRLGMLEILDEHHHANLTLDQHVQRIERHGWPRPAWIGTDPAGGARSSQTGISDVQCLRNLGYHVRIQRLSLRSGLDRVRRRIDRGTVRIDPRCRHLIDALSTYRYPARNPGAEQPLKNGPDHACDALRYLITNLELGPAPVAVRAY